MHASAREAVNATVAARHHPMATMRRERSASIHRERSVNYAKVRIDEVKFGWIALRLTLGVSQRETIEIEQQPVDAGETAHLTPDGKGGGVEVRKDRACRGACQRANTASSHADALGHRGDSCLLAERGKSGIQLDISMFMRSTIVSRSPTPAQCALFRNGTNQLVGFPVGNLSDTLYRAMPYEKLLNA
jgi:hypothetical protein